MERATRCVCGYTYYPDKPSYRDVDKYTEEWNQPFDKKLIPVYFNEGDLYNSEIEPDDHRELLTCPRCKTVRVG